MEEAVICNASEPYESSETFQNCLGEMLRVLGMSDAAKPKSPHEVFQSALAEMKRQLTDASAEARLREAWPNDGELLNIMEKSGYDCSKTHPKCFNTFGWKTFADKLKDRLAHPHASDCDRFKHFAPDGGKTPVRPDAPDHLTVKTSAEARLRDALERELSGNSGQLRDIVAAAIRGAGSDLCDGDWVSLSEDQKEVWRGDADRALAAIKEYLTTTPALSAHPHASDCDKQGER